MPILEEDFTIDRPAGTRFANGATRSTLFGSILSARHAFELEFGRQVKQELEIIEVLGVTAGYSATVLEVYD